MKDQGKLITGVVVGAGAMYLLDPDRGARRRSLLRDKGIHVGHKLGDGMAATARDTKNRTIGAAAELRSRFRRDQVDDEVLHERVRSTIGRVVSHPGAIDVIVSAGRVTLTGHVLADELNMLLQRVHRVRGVTEVRNELEIHRSSEGVTALQGPGRTREERAELFRGNWAPGLRVAIGAAGSVLVLRGLRTGGGFGRALSVAGAGLIARAMSNIGFRKLIAVVSSPAIAVEKTLTVRAPVDQVWELWSNFDNFPRFMTHLREVRKVDESHSHWVAVGPAGVPIEWEAVVTDWVPRQFIGWTSVEGSPIETTGQVRFRPTTTGETEIDVRMTYRPPAGAAGHAIAYLVGSDPKGAMDDDLVRLKSLIEDGKTRADGEPVRLEEVVAEKESARPKKASSRGRKS